MNSPNVIAFHSPVSGSSSTESESALIQHYEFMAEEADNQGRHFLAGMYRAAARELLDEETK